VDESVIKHLEQPRVSALKMSEAIRLGKRTIGDNEADNCYQLCALGCAWAGVFGHQLTNEEFLRQIIQRTEGADFPGTMAETLGFPKELGIRVNKLHLAGRTALAIAAQLEAEGL
jgi:hypothetical protein